MKTVMKTAMKTMNSVKWIALGSVVLIGGLGVYLFLPKSGHSPNAVKPPMSATTAMPRYQAGPFTIGVRTNPAIPKVGDNQLLVEVRDTSGSPVSLQIEAYAEMPAMGAMQAMRAPADLKEVAPGRYEGSMDLAMRGEWPLTLTMLASQGEPLRLQFDLATDRADMPIAAGGVRIDEADSSASDSGGMPRYRTDNLEIAIDINPSIAQVGDNKIMIEVYDETGQVLTDVDVNAYAQMPAMGAMPAMRAPADLKQTGLGRYEGSVNLSMRGEWPLTVEINSATLGSKRLQFDLATDRAGLTIAAGAARVGETQMPLLDSSNVSNNVITIDNRRRQMIGVQTGEVTHRDLVQSIRAVGQVNFDERLLSQVTLKFNGFIGDLKANYVGAEVSQGQVLFTVYSPELLAAQQEYLDTYRRRSASNDNALLNAVRQRLQLWDMSATDIKALESRGVPQDYVAIYAPTSGTVIERNITDGSAATMGRTLLTIADLSRVWIEADVFEADLELVQVGMSATITLPYLPGRVYTATVEYVYPYLQGKTRTGRIRLSLDNKNGDLKPDMYADVSLQAEIGHRLSVPEEAILFAGESRVVFVDLGAGRLKPVHIKIGRSAQGFVEVLGGLSLGDRVVTSGNFLIASETRLKTGISQW